MVGGVGRVMRVTATEDRMSWEETKAAMEAARNGECEADPLLDAAMKRIAELEGELAEERARAKGLRTAIDAAAPACSALLARCEAAEKEAVAWEARAKEAEESDAAHLEELGARIAELCAERDAAQKG
jgi:capsule polysaccharide export protein KpsE/RkpR